MPYIIYTLDGEPEPLRQITVVGAPAGPDHPSVPLWTLAAGAPDFDHKYARDARGKESGTSADSTFPVRVLTLDQARRAKGIDPLWRQPRLLSVHLLAAARNRHYRNPTATDKPSSDFLQLGWPGAEQVSSRFGDTFRTINEDAPDDRDAPFVHVVAEALPADGKPWELPRPDEDEVAVPPLRLLAGRIGLRVKTGANGLKWLTALGVHADADGWGDIWLVQDGIEFEATLPFPGAVGLAGRVLLHRQPDGFRLELLQAGDEITWRDAWRAVIPARDAAETLFGLRFAASSERLPVFQWPLEVDAGSLRFAASQPVEIAPGDISIALVSPAMGGAIDGVAALRLDRVAMQLTADGRVAFSFGAGKPVGAKLACRFGTDGLSAASTASTLHVDVARLAGDLRAAYGLDTPPPVPSRRPAGQLFGAGYERPVISAFVALDDGWLQLPIPNLGPLDIDSDRVLAAARAPGDVRNVINGFFRLKPVGGPGVVQSGHQPDAWHPGSSEQTPWMVTVERASGSAGTVLLTLGAGGAAKLIDASVDLYGPGLSARGLLWVSSDRPDALEALPRLGAGPGAFIDMAMDTDDHDDMLQADFDSLEFSATKAGKSLARWSKLSLAFNPQAARWRNEVLKPVEAQLALRAAGACIEGAGFTVLPVDLLWQDVMRTQEVLYAIEGGLAQAQADVGAASTQVAQLALDPVLKKDLAQAGKKLDQLAKEADQARTELAKAELALRSGLAKVDRLPPPEQLLHQVVAWRRHPVIPLAANMPMTRMAAGSVRPLESRELMPFALAWAKYVPGKPQLLAVLEGSVHAPLLRLHASMISARAVAAWPGATGGAPLAERGISFACVGVAGVELNAADAYQAAVRYDLPLLDEAFASAALPPDEASRQRARAAAAAAGVATALDWPRLARFWGEQERKHQNSRVQDSYLSPYFATDIEKEFNVTTLISGMKWKPVLKVETRCADAAVHKLPYGTLSIDGGAPVSGNAALPGYSATFEGGNITVLGNSPATFRDKDFDFELDNRRCGAGPAKPAGLLVERAVALHGVAGKLRLVSLAEPLALLVNKKPFEFWFKDVLFKDNDAQLAACGSALDFSVLDEDAKLAASGFEWRLSAPGDELPFALGRHQLPFFGFLLEPLRLVGVTLAGSAVAAVKLLCRLTLGDATPGAGHDLFTLTLKAGADAWTLVPAFEREAQDLRYVFRLRDRSAWPGTHSALRRVTVALNLKPGPSFAPDGIGMQIELAQITVLLGVPTIKLEAGTVSCSVTPKEQAGKAGTARLRVLEARIKASHVPESTELHFEHVVEIFPTDEYGAADSPVISWRSTADDSGVQLFGYAAAPVSRHADADNGALALRFNGGLGKEATLACAMIAKLERQPAVPGIARLVAGHCEGAVIQKATLTGALFGPGIDIAQGRLEFTVASGTDGVWRGQATVSAAVTARSAIEWPALAFPDPPDPIPKPFIAGPVSGRVRVTLDAVPAPAQHEVEWTLAGHQLPLALAAAILRPFSSVAWVTPVVGRHLLTRGTTTLQWSGVESMALGRPAGIVPKPHDDSTTFGARFKARIENGNQIGNEPGMLRAGLGSTATVLQGALGAGFRSAFWDIKRGDTIMAAGGFLGMLDQGAPRAPLLRLPLLAGMAEKLSQTNFGQTPFELAWSDGRAACALALSRPSAPSPANASFAAVSAALVAGSLAHGHPDEVEQDVFGSLLAEQSFGTRRVEQKVALDAPFFLAAAVSVDSALRAAGQGPGKVQALSLLAGYALLRNEDGDMRMLALAAAITMRDAEPLTSSILAPPQLVVLGAKLRSVAWAAAPRLDAGGTILPAVRGQALTLDPDPAAFLVSWPDNPDTQLFSAGVFPSLALDKGAIAPRSRSAATFADAGRGHLAVPVAAHITRWLSAPEEGRVSPVRDDASPPEPSPPADAPTTPARPLSGLAGLGHRMRLPAHTGAATALTGEGAGADLVWLSQTRAPAWLPMHISGLKGPPIGWLQSAPPLVRLPLATDIEAALLASGSAGTEAAPRVVQGFLPDELSLTSVGERAGVLTIRRARLLAALDGAAALGVKAYDAENICFGRPGQAGSSFARKLRTPRPAPLPENRGDALRDRRIQASTVRPRRACDVLFGSADIVQGGAGKILPLASYGAPDHAVEESFDAWSIVAVAAPETASIVNARWDGSLALVLRVEVLVKGSATLVTRPLQFVMRTLLTGLGTPVPDARAMLRIGATVLEYGWVTLPKNGAWTWLRKPSPAGDGSEHHIHTAEVRLVLDPGRGRPFIEQEVHGAIALALAGAGPLPAVELHWTVHPTSRGSTRVAPPEQPLALFDPAQTAPASLAAGTGDAPLVLRIPLYPVSQARGTMPLTPASIIFNDPAYDRDLSGPPKSDIKPINPAPAGLEARGALRLALDVDRDVVNCQGVITFMLDVRYERPMDALAQDQAEAANIVAGGDLEKPGSLGQARCSFMLTTQEGVSRPLKLPAPEAVRLGIVYTLPLAALREDDGTPARLHAGDTLAFTLALDNSGPLELRLWNAGAAKVEPVTIAKDAVNVRAVRLLLSDDAVIEPPPALYAALHRTSSGDKKWRLSMPLHAQSPLPRRIDLVEPGRGFRTGMLHRHASFVWYLSCPASQLAGETLYVMKSDRNGQAYWPEEVSEFNEPVKLGAKP